MQPWSEVFKNMKLRSRILLVCAVMFIISFIITARSSLQTRILTNRMEDSFSMDGEWGDSLGMIQVQYIYYVLYFYYYYVRS